MIRKLLKLGEVADINAKNINRDSDFEYISYIDIASVGEGFFKSRPEKMLLESSPKRARRLVKEQDILLSTVRPNRRSMIYLRTVGEDWVASTGFCVLSPKTELVDPRYLYYCIFHTDFTANLISLQKEGNYPTVASEDIQNTLIKLPDMDMQRRISFILGSIDDKIESNQREINLAEQSILSRFDSFFDVGEKPDGVPITELIEIGPKRNLSKGVITTYVGMAHLPEFSLSVSQWDEKEYTGGQRFSNGDVLMARITPCLENGKTAVVDMLEPSQVGFGSTEYIVLAPKEDFSTAWVYGFARNRHVREWAIKQMNGSSGRQRFSSSAFDNYRIKIPEPDLLAKFNHSATVLLELCRNKRDEILRLRDLRDTLLPELLSGRITPDQLEAGYE